jgi:hypothetical protein
LSNKFSADKVSSDMITMMAKQMGAVSVKSNPAHINIYRFQIAENLTLVYKVDLRRGKSIYLHRTAPYPMMLGKFYGESEVIEYMHRDLLKFRNAYRSSKFGHYLDLAVDLTSMNSQIEQLFMNRNVPESGLEALSKEFKRMRETIQEVEAQSPLLYEKEQQAGISPDEEDEDVPVRP